MANEFKLTGRVNFIEAKAFNSGAFRTRVLLAQKSGNDYISFAVDTLDNKNRNIASEMIEEVQKGDYLLVEGKLTKNKYTTKDGREVDEINLLAFNYTVVEYDEVERKYVPRKKENCVENEKVLPVEKLTIHKNVEEIFGTEEDIDIPF